MLRLAVPTVLYVATNLVAVSFRNSTALSVTPKGPAALMYAWTFYQLPYGIIAVALATAVFTELSDSAGRKDYSALKEHFSRGLRVTGVLMLPAAAMLIALSEPLVSLYRVGQFKASDVPMVASILRLWALGLLFFACMMFVLRTFYSLKDTRTPMLANLALTPVQIGLYVVLSTGVATWGGLGIRRNPHRRRRLLRAATVDPARLDASPYRRVRPARRRRELRSDADRERAWRCRGLGSRPTAGAARPAFRSCARTGRCGRRRRTPGRFRGGPASAGARGVVRNRPGAAGTAGRKSDSGGAS